MLPKNEPVTNESPRSLLPKLLSGATGGSIMVFGEVVAPGTTTVGGAGTWAFMPRGVPHCCKYTGAATGRILFLYTPAKAGGLIEEQQRTSRTFASMTRQEQAEMLQRHGWELLGPSPL